MVSEATLYNEIKELRNELKTVKKKQQTTQELLLATYDLLEHHLISTNKGILHSEEFVDEFTKKIINESTPIVVKGEIGGLYASIPECSNCGQRRFMIPHSYDGRPNGTHNWTYWCSDCGTETEIEELKEE